MSEIIPYPSSSVWYVRVASKVERGQGSGVGIRLRKKGQQGTEETYILTCAHVIRRLGIDENELGAKHDSIWVLPAGYGYDPENGIPVSLVKTVTPLNTYAAIGFYDQPTDDVENADWAILEFDDYKWKNCRDPRLIVRRWSAHELKAGDKCTISGYPDGAQGFSGHDDGKDNRVRPKPGYNILTVENVANALITFDGTQSRAGMSGGGVFREDRQNNDLCGLHRARYDEQMQLKAVSAHSILQRLDELGYEPVELFEPAKAGTKWTNITITVFVALLFLVVVGWMVWPRPDPILLQNFYGEWEKSSTSMMKKMFVDHQIQGVCEIDLSRSSTDNYVLLHPSLGTKSGKFGWVTVTPKDHKIPFPGPISGSKVKFSGRLTNITDFTGIEVMNARIEVIPPGANQ